MRTQARTGWAIAAAAAAIVASVAGPTVARAEPAGAGFTATPDGILSITLQNKKTGRCLEQGANGHVFTAPCNGSSQQRWNWFGSDPEWRSLANAWSEECLDGTSSGGRVYTLSCNGSDYQKWKHSSGQFNQRQSVQNLDSNFEGSVYLSPWNGSDYQQWL
ncbi:hypothetical protein ACFTSF_29275 [Kribbella sp. NPDC056951]|uniref:RICIN domain-containing protein n=1 Tax=Kribbella sp. NPDC056951 TaxID=3345978 RepID=UPI00363D53F0